MRQAALSRLNLLSKTRLLTNFQIINTVRNLKAGCYAEISHSTPSTQPPMMLLKNWNFRPLLILDVFIDREEEHEGKEETSAAKKVPDVVSENVGF